MASPLPNVKTSLGKVRTHTVQVAQEIAEKWPLYFVWGIGPTGDHKAGRALDFMVYDNGTVLKPGAARPVVGRQISEYLVANHQRLGIWYVIWNRRIWSTTRPGKGWIPYDGDNPHTDHVHVSFLDKPPTYAPPPAPEDDMANADEVLKAVLSMAAKNEAQYQALLKNVQQEDPRWTELFKRLDELEVTVKALR